MTEIHNCPHKISTTVRTEIDKCAGHQKNAIIFDTPQTPRLIHELYLRERHHGRQMLGGGRELNGGFGGGSDILEFFC